MEQSQHLCFLGYSSDRSSHDSSVQGSALPGSLGSISNYPFHIDPQSTQQQTTVSWGTKGGCKIKIKNPQILTSPAHCPMALTGQRVSGRTGTTLGILDPPPVSRKLRFLQNLEKWQLFSFQTFRIYSSPLAPRSRSENDTVCRV